MKRLLMGIAVTLAVAACNKESVDADKQSISRAEFIQNKSEVLVKNDYLALSFNEQKSLWISKFEQASATALPEEHLELIEEITEELSGISSTEELYANVAIRDNFIKLAEITPKQEFINIFMSLNDYTPDRASFTNVEECLDCGVQAAGQWTSYKLQKESEKAAQAITQVQECNCDWTCDDAEGDADLGLCVTGNCEGTTSGCGFLWLGSCDTRNIPCPA